MILILKIYLIKNQGPSYDLNVELELITAPYTDDIQVQMRSSSFRSFDLIEYFVVFVGKQIDCEKSKVFKV